MLTRAPVLNTDESNIYKKLGKSFAKHETVNPSQNEYGRGLAYTNTIEGYSRSSNAA